MCLLVRTIEQRRKYCRRNDRFHCPKQYCHYQSTREPLEKEQFRRWVFRRFAKTDACGTWRSAAVFVEAAHRNWLTDDDEEAERKRGVPERCMRVPWDVDIYIPGQPA